MALCLVVVGLGRLLTHPPAGSVGAWEDDLARWVAGQRTPALGAVAEVGTSLGNTVTGLVLLVLLATGFSLRQRSWSPAVLVAVVAAGIFGLYLVATQLDPGPRPPVRILDPGLVPDHSFPSGHVATATAAARRTGAHRAVAALPGGAPPHRRADRAGAGDGLGGHGGDPAAARSGAEPGQRSEFTLIRSSAPLLTFHRRSTSAYSPERTSTWSARRTASRSRVWSLATTTP